MDQSFGALGADHLKLCPSANQAFRAKGIFYLRAPTKCRLVIRSHGHDLDQLKLYSSMNHAFGVRAFFYIWALIEHGSVIWSHGC